MALNLLTICFCGFLSVFGQTGYAKVIKPQKARTADHEQEKGDYADKVAFVYLADETSPETLWNERIKAFTGEHYRLPLNQHQNLMQRFNFQSYPSYIIINSNGDIVSTTNHIHSLSELDEWLK